MCDWCVNCTHYGGEPIGVMNSKGWCSLYKVAKAHLDECEGEGYKKVEGKK